MGPTSNSAYITARSNFSNFEMTARETCTARSHVASIHTETLMATEKLRSLNFSVRAPVKWSATKASEYANSLLILTSMEFEREKLISELIENCSFR